MKAFWKVHLGIGKRRLLLDYEAKRHTRCTHREFGFKGRNVVVLGSTYQKGSRMAARVLLYVYRCTCTAACVLLHVCRSMCIPARVLVHVSYYTCITAHISRQVHHHYTSITAYSWHSPQCQYCIEHALTSHSLRMQQD